MKLSKQYLLEQLEVKTPEDLATEIATDQLKGYKTPTGYSVDFNATVRKYTLMLINLKNEKVVA